jgi:hypothetical protein
MTKYGITCNDKLNCDSSHLSSDDANSCYDECDDINSISPGDDIINSTNQLHQCSQHGCYKSPGKTRAIDNQTYHMCDSCYYEELKKKGKMTL